MATALQPELARLALNLKTLIAIRRVIATSALAREIGAAHISEDHHLHRRPQKAQLHRRDAGRPGAVDAPADSSFTRTSCLALILQKEDAIVS
jgi:hypothetical protein